MFDTRPLAGPRCGRRYEEEYRIRNNRDCMIFYYDGRVRFERYCYGEAASLTFGVWADGVEDDGTIRWRLPEKGYCEPDALPKRLELDKLSDAVLRFDGTRWKWELAEEFDADEKNGYKKWSSRFKRMISRR